MAGKSNDGQLGLFDQGYGSVEAQGYGAGFGENQSDGAGSDQDKGLTDHGEERGEPSREEIMKELHEEWRVVGEVKTLVHLEAHRGGWLVQVHAAVAGFQDCWFMGKLLVQAQGAGNPEDAPDYTRHVVALQAVDRLVGGSARSHGLSLGSVEESSGWHEGEAIYNWQVLSRQRHSGVAMACKSAGTGDAWELVPLG